MNTYTPVSTEEAFELNFSLYKDRLLDIYGSKFKQALGCRHRGTYALLDGEGCAQCNFTRSKGIHIFSIIRYKHIAYKVHKARESEAATLLKHLVDNNRCRLDLLKTSFNFPIPKITYSAGTYRTPIFYNPTTNYIFDIVPMEKLSNSIKLLIKHTRKILHGLGFKYTLYILDVDGEVRRVTKSDLEVKRRGRPTVEPVEPKVKLTRLEERKQWHKERNRKLRLAKAQPKELPWD